MVSVLTLTRNRAQYLKQCLQSLVGQVAPSDEVIVVDNNSSDNTRQILRQYMRVLPLRVFRTSLQGYPLLYNYAIKKSKGDVLVFFDDDCVADKSFIASIKAAHKKYPHSAIQGKTYSLPPNNIYAEVMGDHYKNWIQSNLLADGVHMKTCDNKNLVIPSFLLDAYGNFDKRLLAGSEDVELGMRFVKKGASIRFEPSIIAHHHERDTFHGFMMQHMRIARSESLVDAKNQNNQRIGMLRWAKLRLHAQSAVHRELLYIRSARIKDALLLPFLYLLLFIVRVTRYSTAR